MKSVRFGDALAEKILALRKKLMSHERQAKEKEAYERLYVGEDARDSMYREQKKKVLSYIYVVLGILVLLAAYYLKGNDGRKTQIDRLARPEYGSRKQTVEMQAEGLENERIDISVGSRKQADDMVDEIFKRAEEYLDREILGENLSPDYVVKPLNLITEIEELDVSVEYLDLDTRFVRHDGTLRNEEIEDQEIVVMNVELTYFDHKNLYMFPLVIFPPEMTEKERFIAGVEAVIDDTDSGTRSSNELSLPSEYDGRTVRFFERNESFAKLALPAFLVIILIPFAFAEDRKKKLRLRACQMMEDYSHIINKLVLLISAGMTIPGAWERICLDYLAYSRDVEKRYAYEEMLITRNEIKLGESLTTAIEQYGKRAGLSEYRKMCKIITANIRHGNKGLLPLLEHEAEDSLKKSREMVRRRGEEASTKLLVPMVIILVLIMAIVLFPAVRTMNS